MVANESLVRQFEARYFLVSLSGAATMLGLRSRALRLLSSLVARAPAWVIRAVDAAGLCEALRSSGNTILCEQCLARF